MLTVRFVGTGDAFGSGGRFQTCILLDAGGVRCAIDFGASSLIALEQQGIAHNSIDIVVLTHLHGDHCGGVPFMLLDAMLGSRRQSSLTIAGPPDVERRLHSIGEALFPGMGTMTPRFPIAYVELPMGAAVDVRGLSVTARPARHTASTLPTSVRIEVAGQVVAYTGDGEFTEDLALTGRNADIFICEAYFFDKPVKWHLNYPAIRDHIGQIGAKRIVLTHMSAEMLAHADDVPEVCAYDGMVITI